MRILAVSVLLFFSSVISNVNAEIREIKVARLNDVAIATMDRYGPVIYINAQIADTIDPFLMEFILEHEHAHHHNRHLERELYEANPYNRVWVRNQYEKEADCFAAKRVSPQALQAAIKFGIVQGLNRADRYHPTGYERVAVIRNCAPGLELQAEAEERVSSEEVKPF